MTCVELFGKADNSPEMRPTSFQLPKLSGHIVPYERNKFSSFLFMYAYSLCKNKQQAPITFPLNFGFTKLCIVFNVDIRWNHRNDKHFF